MRKTLIAFIAATALLGGCQQPVGEPAAAPAGNEASVPVGGPPMGDPKDNPDMTGLAAAVDTGRNGELSRAEWKAKGLPDSSFNMFEKGRGYVTLKDYLENAAPKGIDLNGDGKLTVEEFISFDKQMATKVKDAPPPPAAQAN